MSSIYLNLEKIGTDELWFAGIEHDTRGEKDTTAGERKWGMDWESKADAYIHYQGGVLIVYGVC